jgi:uncharacterized cupredoxin-like copper-binding protein
MKLIGLVCLGLGVAAFVAAAAGADASATAKSAAVTFKMVEWDILPTTSTKAVPGRVTFVVRNSGTLTHEFVVLRTAKAAGTLAPSRAAEAPETGSAGEIGEIKPGAVKRLTLSLRRGHYSLICNLRGHYNNGQFVDFYVRTP